MQQEYIVNQKLLAQYAKILAEKGVIPAEKFLSGLTETERLAIGPDAKKSLVNFCEVNAIFA